MYAGEGWEINDDYFLYRRQILRQSRHHENLFPGQPVLLFYDVPFSWCQAKAIFIAVSAASEPELT